VLAVLVLASCAEAPRHVTVNVGAARVRFIVPRGYEHVDNGGRHEFRNGDVRITLEDEGIATPESLASKLRAARVVLEKGRNREAIERLSDRDDPVLAARDREDLAAFWREWNSIAYDPTLRSETDLAPALDGLIQRASALPPLDGHTFAMFTVLQELDTVRYQIEKIAPVRDSTAWWEARTWSRVSHTSPRVFASRVVEGRLLLLDSGNYLPPEAEKAFEELLGSIEPEEASVRLRTASR
jgi:hypothetical protein